MTTDTLHDTGLTRDLIVRETDKAILFTLPGRRSMGVTARTRDDDVSVWLPKSHITWMRPSPVYAESAHVPGWLARRLPR